MITLSAITSVNKKKKQNKEERLATIKAGAEGRDKFGAMIKDSKLGKTNSEKRKSKNFQMVKHKMNKKFKRSFKDKQVSFRALFCSDEFEYKILNHLFCIYSLP